MRSNAFKVLGKPIYFENAIEAQQYAQKHTGTVVVRNNIQETSLFPEQYKPLEILEYLDRFIISQDDAKKEIAIAMYYHNLNKKYIDNNYLDKNGPVMIIGPTGSAKTFIVKKACEYIDIVFVHVDTSSMVSEGIVGYSTGNLAVDIVKKAKLDIKKAEHCVVFFDEIDKLFQSSDNEYGEEVSNQLLRFIEGTEVHITAKDVGSKEDMILKTDNMQFILGGAFQWIIDKKQKEKNSSMGFSLDCLEKDNNSITLEDLYREDIPKELLGRMDTIVNVHKLTFDDCYKILTKSESSPLDEFLKKDRVPWR